MAYQLSAERYQAIRQSLGEPDPFRLRYRNALHEMVRIAVQGRFAPTALPARIEAYLDGSAIAGPDHARFLATTLQELRNLNEGTFARHGLRPSEFEPWQDVQRELRRET